jgi:hypothetical protein
MAAPCVGDAARSRGWSLLLWRPASRAPVSPESAVPRRSCAPRAARPRASSTARPAPCSAATGARPSASHASRASSPARGRGSRRRVGVSSRETRTRSRASSISSWPIWWLQFLPRPAPPRPSRRPRRVPRRRPSTAWTLAARHRVSKFAPLDRPARRPATEFAAASGRPCRAAIFSAERATGARVRQDRRVALTPARRNARRRVGASDRLALIASRAPGPTPAPPAARGARRGRSRARAPSYRRRPSRPPHRLGGARDSAGR